MENKDMVEKLDKYINELKNKVTKLEGIKQRIEDIDKRENELIQKENEIRQNKVGLKVEKDKIDNEFGMEIEGLNKLFVMSEEKKEEKKVVKKYVPVVPTKKVEIENKGTEIVKPEMVKGLTPEMITDLDIIKHSRVYKGDRQRIGTCLLINKYKIPRKRSVVILSDYLGIASQTVADKLGRQMGQGLYDADILMNNVDEFKKACIDIHPWKKEDINRIFDRIFDTFFENRK